MVSETRIRPPQLPILLLSGVTASGKTSLSIEWAKKHGNLEIINADSLLVFKGFNIGTAKPSLEERDGIPHHLIDVCEPFDPFTAGDFVRHVSKILDELEVRKKRVLIVGGTGFYLKALFLGMWGAEKSDPLIRESLEIFETDILFQRLLILDPASAQKIGPGDRYRLLRALETHLLSGELASKLQEKSQEQGPIPGLHLCFIDRENAEIEARIQKRTEMMIKNGLIEEVKNLLNHYRNARALDSVGYRETVAYLENRSPEGRKMRPGLPGLQDEIALGTRQLVKKQRTFFQGQFLKPYPDLVKRFTLPLDQEKLETYFWSLYS